MTDQNTAALNAHEIRTAKREIFAEQHRETAEGLAFEALLTDEDLLVDLVIESLDVRALQQALLDYEFGSNENRFDGAHKFAEALVKNIAYSIKDGDLFEKQVDKELDEMEEAA